MNNNTAKIEFEALGMQLEELQKLNVVKSGKIKIEPKPDSKFFIATNLTDDPKNFYALGVETAGSIIYKLYTLEELEK